MFVRRPRPHVPVRKLDIGLLSGSKGAGTKCLVSSYRVLADRASHSLAFACAQALEAVSISYVYLALKQSYTKEKKK